jgi:hypothetical protein
MCMEARVERRSDHVSERLVDMALTIRESTRVLTAAMALASAGIPIEVARRVLLLPLRRRQPDKLCF